jgi:hypothetical protein
MHFSPFATSFITSLLIAKNTYKKSTLVDMIAIITGIMMVLTSIKDMGISELILILEMKFID